MPLSDSKLRGVRATGTRFELPDRDGLILRVGASGSMAWTVNFAVRRVTTKAGAPSSSPAPEKAGQRRRATLGFYPAMSLSEARQAAAVVVDQARCGIEPFPEPAAGEGGEPAKPMTVGELFAVYKRDHLDRNLSSGGNVEKLLRRHVIPRWDNRPIASLTPPDLIALLEEVRRPGGALVKAAGQDTAFAAVRGGPGAAIEVRKWVRAMTQHAASSGLLPGNPFQDVRNRDRSRPRDRVLSMEELAAVWHVAGGLMYPWNPLLRLLILTGSRRNEWAEAETGWIDAETTRLEVPSSAYKTGKTTIFPFSTQVRAIVRGLPQPLFGPYILSTSGGMQPVSGFSKLKAQLDDALALRMKMPPWTIHDLRRSFSTHSERLGVTPHVVEACLGHALRGVAGIYRHYAYFEEKKSALQLWADEIERAAYPMAIAAE